MLGDPTLDFIPLVVASGEKFDYYESKASPEFIQSSAMSLAISGDVSGDEIDDIVLVGASIRQIGCFYEKDSMNHNPSNKPSYIRTMDWILIYQE